MDMTGYSGTPLQTKLGLKAGMRVTFFHAPSNYWELISPLPDGLEVIEKSKKGTIDFVHLFTKEKKAFEKEFVRSREFLKKDGMLWISWPKKSSKVATDLDESLIREFGLRSGLVDVKVCAVDETWSGLKLVYRLADR